MYVGEMQGSRPQSRPRAAGSNSFHAVAAGVNRSQKFCWEYQQGRAILCRRSSTTWTWRATSRSMWALLLTYVTYVSNNISNRCDWCCPPHCVWHSCCLGLNTRSYSLQTLVHEHVLQNRYWAITWHTIWPMVPKKAGAKCAAVLDRVHLQSC